MMSAPCRDRRKHRLAHGSTHHLQPSDRVAADCMERMCEVEKDDVKEKTIRPPKLYDLTTL